MRTDPFSFCLIALWILAPGGFGSTRLRPLEPSSRGIRATGFTRLSPAETGLGFTNVLSPVFALNNQILENGAGVALGDVDGDGRCDIYLCGSEGSNRLYLNRGGWHFEDATPSWGAACDGQFSTGAVLVDIDGDGALDLLVNGLGTGTRLFRNAGQQRFVETPNAGLSRTAAATSMALGDVDSDGDLDLYVATYRTESARNAASPPAITARRIGGRLHLEPASRFFGFLRSDGSIEVVEKGEPDGLYLNDGRGHFDAVDWKSGAFTGTDGKPLVAAPEDWGLSVLMRDLNGDGFTDIYVCNDFFRSRDQFWLGDGRGHFRAAPASVCRDFPASSMAVDAADINRDGHDDFIVVEMLGRSGRDRLRQRANPFRSHLALPLSDPGYQPEVPRNVLQVSRGDGTFTDIAWYAGLAATDWSWSAVFMDVDLDGWEDLLVGTGNAHDVLDADAVAGGDRAAGGSGGPTGLGAYPPLPQRRLAYRNRHDLTFEEVGAEWGFAEFGVAPAIALGDLDNDGDLDIVVNELNAPVALYRNDSTAPRVSVALSGRGMNRSGIGARIRVSGGPVVQQQVVVSGGRYLGSDEPIRTFAAAGARSLTVDVLWPTGGRSVVENVTSGTRIEIDEAESSPAAPSKPIPPTPVATLFRDETRQLNLVIPEPPSEALRVQPLLSWGTDAFGPGIAWADVDGDGWSDLVVPWSKDGTPSIVRNQGGAGWARIDARAGGKSPQVVAAAALVLPGPPGSNAAILAGFRGSSGSATPASGIGLRVLAGRDGEWEPGVQLLAAGGFTPLAAGDVDGDGILDVVVQAVGDPRRFPGPTTGWLLLRGGTGDRRGRPASHQPPPTAGALISAVLTDLDDDGRPELVTASFAGPLRIYRMGSEGIDDITANYGLDGFTGFWLAVASGDFDGDGRMDLAVGNLGMNAHYRGRLPWRIHYGDWNGDGVIELIEAGMEDGRWVPWRGRDVLLPHLPWLAEAFPSHRSFASASTTELLGARSSASGHVDIQRLDSMVLLNRGSRFEPRSLPAEAQFAPATGISAGDFDGDGNQDLVLAQNFFDVEIETVRHDAGRGLVLRGDGAGGFSAVPSWESGVEMPGNGRGVAVADYDRDGRLDFAATPRGGAVRVYRNLRGKPGVRIRAALGPGNPAGIGTRIRLADASGPFGAVQEFQAGHGRYSQDDPVRLLPQHHRGTRLWVRWPGGSTEVHPIPPGAGQCVVSPGHAPKIESAGH